MEILLTKSMLSKDCSQGFTLVELLLAMVVLGVLTSVVAIAINPAQRLAQARDSKRISDLKQIAEALEAYFTVNRFYPLPTCTFNSWERSEKAGNQGDCSGNKAEFMEYLTEGSWLKRVPLDPLHFKDNPLWGYLYTASPDGKHFCLLAHLEDSSNQILTNDANFADLNCDLSAEESWWYAIASD